MNTEEIKQKVLAICEEYFDQPDEPYQDYDEAFDELWQAREALRSIRNLVKDSEPPEKHEATEPAHKPEADPTDGMKLWRVTVEQTCSETVHVWAKTLKEARDAVNEDLGDYESQVHCWELDEVESTEVYEGEPTDSDSDYEEDPDDVNGNIYTVKDGKLADID